MSQGSLFDGAIPEGDIYTCELNGRRYRAQLMVLRGKLHVHVEVQQTEAGPWTECRWRPRRIDVVRVTGLGDWDDEVGRIRLKDGRVEGERCSP